MSCSRKMTEMKQLMDWTAIFGIRNIRTKVHSDKKFPFSLINHDKIISQNKYSEEFVVDECECFAHNVKYFLSISIYVIKKKNITSGIFLPSAILS